MWAIKTNVSYHLARFSFLLYPAVNMGTDMKMLPATVIINPPLKRGLFLATPLLFILLNACAGYRPRPLQDTAPLAEDLAALQIKATKLHSTPLKRYKINLADGLDLTEVGILAVINNPALKVQRAKLGVAGAQAFAAGLLPDPEISASVDRPTGNADPVNAWGVGINYDLMALITHQAAIDAGRQGKEALRLDLLWQEWRLIQQARSLAVRLYLEAQQLTLLRKMRDLQRQRYQRSTQALQRGDTTLDVSGADLTALLDTRSRINRLERMHNQSRHRFSLALGLDPHALVSIASLPPLTPLTADAIRARLAKLAEVRPDLLALKAGYARQEARVRAAILAQFPTLSIGINRARDTGNVDTIGLGLSLRLPVFSGNRGKIAMARATRAQLQAEYQARLAQTTVDVDRLQTQQSLIQRQQALLATYLPQLKALLEDARHAYRHGDLDALALLNIESTWINKGLEQLSLDQAGWENHIALEALLALPGYPEQPLSTAVAGKWDKGKRP